ncbi:PREDICTED: uncharacterized protein LOC102836051 [Chrysochloris asiatica]|uniref:Prefoldin subunit 1 n=1 Tax=Chrysochloris asiatica TaxID=185453 RepID=A0A9B0U8V1_CHRAS|nr:PREDICTED: uncharacterized protein LOC102836051 [Chrysochloris asiatica]
MQTNVEWLQEQNTILERKNKVLGEGGGQGKQTGCNNIKQAVCLEAIKNMYISLTSDKTDAQRRWFTFIGVCVLITIVHIGWGGYHKAWIQRLHNAEGYVSSNILHHTLQRSPIYTEYRLQVVDPQVSSNLAYEIKRPALVRCKFKPNCTSAEFYGQPPSPIPAPELESALGKRTAPYSRSESRGNAPGQARPALAYKRGLGGSLPCLGAFPTLCRRYCAAQVQRANQDGSPMDLELKKAFTELQAKVTDTQQKVKLADIQNEQLKLNRMKKHAHITEIMTLVDETNMHEGVGRMFILQSKEVIHNQLLEKQKIAEEKIEELEQKKSYLERSVKEAEDNIPEMLMARRAQ